MASALVRRLSAGRGGPRGRGLGVVVTSEPQLHAMAPSSGAPAQPGSLDTGAGTSMWSLAFVGAAWKLEAALNRFCRRHLTGVQGTDKGPPTCASDAAPVRWAPE